MLSIEQSKEILNCNGANYSDKEIEIIREFIYALAEIDYQLFKRKQEKEIKVIPIDYLKNEKKSHSLHPGIHRRAS